MMAAAAGAAVASFQSLAFVAVLAVVGCTVLNYFNYRNNRYTTSESWTARDMLMFVTYGSLLLLTIARTGASKILRLGSFEKLLIEIYHENGFSEAVLFTRVRHWLPFDLLLIILEAVCWACFSSDSHTRSLDTAQRSLMIAPAEPTQSGLGRC